MPPKKHIQLHVDSPCQQPWSEMRPEGNGRFCDHCQKTVIDFQEMSDVEIARILALPNAPTCGRFRPSQLERPIPVYAFARAATWPKIAAGAALFMLSLPHSLLAQASSNPQGVPKDIAKQIKLITNAPQKTLRMPTQESSLVADAPKYDPCDFVLTGRVIDVNSGRPFAKASVGVMPFVKPIFTDEDGNFSLNLKLDQLPDTVTLHISLPYEEGENDLVFLREELPVDKIVVAVESRPRPIMGGIGPAPRKSSRK